MGGRFSASFGFEWKGRQNIMKKAIISLALAALMLTVPATIRIPNVRFHRCGRLRTRSCPPVRDLR